MAGGWLVDFFIFENENCYSWGGSSIGVHLHSSIGTAQRVSLELIILQDPLRSGLGSQLRILSSLNHVDGPMAFQASYSGKAPQLPCGTISRMRLRWELCYCYCYTAIRGHQNGFPARFRLNHPLNHPDCSSLSVSQKELVCLNGLTFSIFQPWSTLSVMRAVVKTWPQKVFLQLIEVIMCVYIYIIHTHTYINATPVLNVPIIKNPW